MNISETAYPRLKATLSQKELERSFTPSPEEKEFAWRKTTDDAQTIRLLVWLKAFQRLGYFPCLDEIPSRLFVRCQPIEQYVREKLYAYSQSSQKWDHHAFVRQYLGVTAYGEAARMQFTPALRQRPRAMTWSILSMWQSRS